MFKIFAVNCGMERAPSCTCKFPRFNHEKFKALANVSHYVMVLHIINIYVDMLLPVKNNLLFTKEWITPFKL